MLTKYGTKWEQMKREQGLKLSPEGPHMKGAQSPRQAGSGPTQSALALMSNHFSKQEIKMSWFTMSNAADKSKRTKIIQSPRSVAESTILT